MCAVSIQESQASKERLLTWAKNKKPLQGGFLSEWMFLFVNGCHVLFYGLFKNYL